MPKGQPFDGGYNTQTWVVERVETGENHYRIRNTANNYYLTVLSDQNKSVVYTYSIFPVWSIQIWIREQDGNAYIFRSAWNPDLALNCAGTDDPFGNGPEGAADYAPINVETFHSDWQSQRWYIE